MEFWYRVNDLKCQWKTSVYVQNGNIHGQGNIYAWVLKSENHTILPTYCFSRYRQFGLWNLLAAKAHKCRLDA